MEVLGSLWCVHSVCGRLDFLSNASSGGDDLVGAVKTFKGLRKELLRRA
jgi:hypothetical protein